MFSILWLLTLVTLLSCRIALRIGLRNNNDEVRDDVSEKVKQLRTDFENKDKFNPDEDYLLIYTYGKTASSSFQHAIPGVKVPYIEGPCERSSPPVVCEAQAKCETASSYSAATSRCPVKDPTSYPRAIKVHHRGVAQDFVEKVPRGKRLWVVTMTRNPFEREFSWFVQNIWWKMPKNEKKANEMTSDELCSAFRHRRKGTEDNIAKWFSEDFFAVTGEDLSKNAIPKVYNFRQRNISKHRTMNIIQLRFEDIASWNKDISKHFSGFSLPWRNVHDGFRGDIHKLLHNHCSFSTDEIAVMAQTDTMKFYTHEEQAAFLSAARHLGSKRDHS